MPAELITRFKNITPDGGVLEVVVWGLLTPVPPSEHGFKFRAVHAKDGVRIAGFDNERCRVMLKKRSFMLRPWPLRQR
jgi:hypothetical protein